MLQSPALEKPGQVFGKVGWSVVSKQPGMVLYSGFLLPRFLRRHQQSLFHIVGIHRGRKLPGQNVAGVNIKTVER